LPEALREGGTKGYADYPAYAMGMTEAPESVAMRGG
jgi:hypothetical protein